MKFLSESLTREKYMRLKFDQKTDIEKKTLLTKANYIFFVKHLDMISPQAIEAALKISNDIK